MGEFNFMAIRPKCIRTQKSKQTNKQTTNRINNNNNDENRWIAISQCVAGQITGITSRWIRCTLKGGKEEQSIKVKERYSSTHQQRKRKAKEWKEIHMRWKNRSIRCQMDFYCDWLCTHGNRNDDSKIEKIALRWETVTLSVITHSINTKMRCWQMFMVNQCVCGCFEHCVSWNNFNLWIPVFPEKNGNSFH